MNSLAPAGRPSIRILAGLVIGVMAAHVLLLRTSAPHWGPGEQTPARPPSLYTRNIEALSPLGPAVAATLQPIKPPLAQTPKSRAAPEPRAPSAINLIAEKSPLPVADLALETSTAAATPVLAVPTAPAPWPNAITAAAAQANPAALPETTKPGLIRLPAPVRLDYVMTGISKGLTYHANAELTWNTTGSQYQASMVVSAFLVGSRSMTSSGQLTAQGLAPTRFLDKSRSERAAHFMADQGKITFSANSPDAAWMDGAQDRVSVFMQLAGMLAGDPAAFPTGSSITLYTIGPTEADTWTFLVAAQESLLLPQGQTPTLKLSRKPRRPYDQAVEIWFAPSLGYLPVRSRITQFNGDFIDQQLKTVTPP